MQESTSVATCSYIIRAWRDDSAMWRVSVRHIPDGKWQGFASLAEATAYIETQLAARHLSTTNGDNQ